MQAVFVYIDCPYIILQYSLIWFALSIMCIIKLEVDKFPIYSIYHQNHVSVFNVKQFNIKTSIFSNEILQKVSSSKFLLFSEYRNIGVDRLIIRKVKIIFSFACLASFRIYIRGNFRFSTFVLCAKTNL